MSSAPLRFSGDGVPASPPNPNGTSLRRRHRFSPWSFSAIPAGHCGRRAGTNTPEQLVLSRISSRSESNEPILDGDVQGLSSLTKASEGINGDSPAKRLSSKGMMQQLRRYGVAGILSYGILNTIYYLTTFLLVTTTMLCFMCLLWFRFYFAPAPGRMGYSAAVKRFLKIMAMVWAGSQVTKILRAGGALALAPVVDRGLSWFTVKFKFESEGKAFGLIVFLCFGLALLLFFGLTLLWA